MELLVIGAVGFLFVGFYDAEVAIVGIFILCFLLAMLFDN